ncbi:MAG: PQQ-binding-like beta-propeller repeat protein, partial [Candidatus Korarchaeota archaeon]|nr:PQQ-binding-like beta-propeller repeat protein [Candidatus Korarchaeota archaeon]
MRLHLHTPLRPLLLLSLVALLALSANPIAATQPAASSTSQSGPIKVGWNHTIYGYIPAPPRPPSPVATGVGFVCVYPDLGSVSLVNPSAFSAAWTFRVESTPSQIVVGGGVVYVVTEWGRVYGIRLLDGTPVFDSKGIEVEGIDTSVAPAYASGVVALPAGKGVVGLNGATGKTEWRVQLPWRVLLMLSGGGKLVIGHTSGVSAIDPVTGDSLWNATFGSPVRAAAIVGSSVLAVTDGGTLHEVDLATGRAGRSLKLPTPDPAPGEIKTGPDILYVVTRRARVYPVGIRSFRRLDVIYLDQNPVAQPEIANYLMLMWTVQGVLLGVPAVPSPVDVVFEYPVGARFISGVGFDPVSQVAMFYLSDGRLVALSVPLYSVQVTDYRVEDGELSADLLVCAFPGTEGDVKLLAKNELGRELFSDTIAVHGAGCFLRSASFNVGASREVRFILSGMGLQSPPAAIALVAAAPPPPPAEPGMVVRAPPSLVVGERAEISIAVTNGWKDGLAYVSVDCEGLDKIRSEEGYVA